MQSIYESNVDPLNPNNTHGTALQLVGKSKSVLELGAASGHVTRALKNLGNIVTAVERDGRFRSDLEKVADSVLITNLDWLDLRSQLEGKKFDVILAGDVLEHCLRPELVLMQLHDLLNPSGYIVISLPNVAHGDVRLALLAGQFEYREVGLLDRTHIRFFTRDTINNLLAQNDFEIVEIFGTTANVGETEFGAPSPNIPIEAIQFVQEDRDARIYQYILKAVPLQKKIVTAVESTTHQLKTKEQLLAEICLLEEFIARKSEPQLVTDLQKAQGDLQKAHNEIETAHNLTLQVERKYEALNMKLQHTLVKLLDARDHAIGASAELGQMRFRFDEAQIQLNSLGHQLHILHGSRTWRIGRFVLLPLRTVRRVLRLIMS